MSKRLHENSLFVTRVESIKVVDGLTVYMVQPEMPISDGQPIEARLICSKKVNEKLKIGSWCLCAKIPNSEHGAYILGNVDSYIDNLVDLGSDSEKYCLSTDYGKILIGAPDQDGLSIEQEDAKIIMNNYNSESNIFLASDNRCIIGSGGFDYSGRYKLTSDNEAVKNNVFSRGYDEDYYKNTSMSSHGTEEKRHPVAGSKKKAVCFTRKVYNMMDPRWLGIDKEWDIKDELGEDLKDPEKELFFNNALYNFGSSLSLCASQSVEEIYGGVFSDDGFCLDPSYKKLINFDPDTKNNYDKHHKLSMRGLGYHFQLSTDYTSNIKDMDPEKNYCMGINREGFLSLNIPKTSNIGFYPNVVKTNFNSDTFSKGSISSASKEVVTEDVPIMAHVIMDTTYVDSKYNEVREKVNECRPDINRISSNKRSTGIGFVGIDSMNKDGSSGLSRINITKYHNMYAAAEILFANNITKVNIPKKNKDNCFLVKGNSFGKSFEIPLALKKVGANGDNNIAKYMTTVITKSSKPAINTGGGVSACGLSELDLDEKPLSNQFDIKDGKEVFPEETLRTGGVSANLNFQGSVITSVGKDDVDGKSIVLDTDGSLISWFGKDNKSRSAVIQTDGSVSLNIGGRSGSSFHKGRFDLRVNINDKGTVKQLKNGEISAERKSTGDYIISISEHGLVIAGMNKNKPMIIRNDGDLCLESTKNIKLIAGNSIIEKKNFSAEKPSGEAEDSTSDKVDVRCKIMDLINSVLGG